MYLLYNFFTKSIQPYSSEVTNVPGKQALSVENNKLDLLLLEGVRLYGELTGLVPGFRLALTVSVFRFLTRSGRRRILTNGSGRSGCFAAKYNHFVQQQI